MCGLKICTFDWVITREFNVVRATLSALFTDVVAEFLAVKAAKWVRYTWVDFDEIVANFEFFWK